MSKHSPLSARKYVGLTSLAGLLILTTLSAQEPAGYTPVSPPAAVQHALAVHLKAVENWLDEKDYTSAADESRNVALLAQLYSYQGSDSAWKKKTQALQDAAGKIAAAAKLKSATDSRKAVRECADLLAELAKAPPAPPQGPDRGFRPFGATKGWMTVMEGTYRDARRADTPAELELSALALAEQANAARMLRGDADWRKAHQEVVALALEAGRQAKAEELEPARKTLKTLYQRCEACHNRSRK